MAKSHIQFKLSDEDIALLEARAAEFGMSPNAFARSILMAVLRDDVRFAAFNAVFWRVYGSLAQTLNLKIYPALRNMLLAELDKAMSAGADLQPGLEPIEGAEEPEIPEEPEEEMQRLEGRRRRRGKRGGRGRT